MQLNAAYRSVEQPKKSKTAIEVLLLNTLGIRNNHLSFTSNSQKKQLHELAKDQETETGSGKKELMNSKKTLYYKSSQPYLPLVASLLKNYEQSTT